MAIYLGRHAFLMAESARSRFRVTEEAWMIRLSARLLAGLALVLALPSGAHAQTSGITGEVVHVDCGFNIMGAPPADFLDSMQKG